MSVGLSQFVNVTSEVVSRAGSMVESYPVMSTAVALALGAMGGALAYAAQLAYQRVIQRNQVEMAPEVAVALRATGGILGYAAQVANQPVIHRSQVEMAPETPLRREYTYELACEKALIGSPGEFVLTGKTAVVREMRLEDDRLRRNLELAKRIIAYVDNKVEFSCTYPARHTINGYRFRHKHVREFEAEVEYQRRSSASCLTALRDLIKAYNELNRSFLTRILYESKRIEFSRIGNCHEMSVIAATYPERQGEEFMLCSLEEPGDHEFLVIGEGDARVVCDPWSRSFYPFDKAPLYLRDYVHKQFKGFPVVSRLKGDGLRAVPVPQVV